MRGQSGPWEASAGSLYHRKPLPAQASCFKHVSHLHLLPVPLRSGRDGTCYGTQEPALLVLAGPSFTQVLPPSTGEVCPQRQQDPQGRGGKESCSAECLHTLRKGGGARGRKPVVTLSRQLCREHSPLLTLDMGSYTLQTALHQAPHLPP